MRHNIYLAFTPQTLRTVWEDREIFYQGNADSIVDIYLKTWSREELRIDLTTTGNNLNDVDSYIVQKADQLESRVSDQLKSDIENDPGSYREFSKYPALLTRENPRYVFEIRGIYSTPS